MAVHGSQARKNAPMAMRVVSFFSRAAARPAEKNVQDENGGGGGGGKRVFYVKKKKKNRMCGCTQKVTMGFFVVSD